MQGRVRQTSHSGKMPSRFTLKGVNFGRFSGMKRPRNFTMKSPLRLTKKVGGEVPLDAYAGQSRDKRLSLQKPCIPRNPPHIFFGVFPIICFFLIAGEVYLNRTPLIDRCRCRSTFSTHFGLCSFSKNAHLLPNSMNVMTHTYTQGYTWIHQCKTPLSTFLPVSSYLTL